MLGMPNEYEIANYFLARATAAPDIPKQLRTVFARSAEIASVFDRLGFKFTAPKEGHIGSLPCADGEIALIVKGDNLGPCPTMQFKLSHRPTQGHCYNHIMALEIASDRYGDTEVRTVSTNGDPDNTSVFTDVILDPLKSFLRAVQGPIADTLDPIMQQKFNPDLSGLNFPRV